MGEDRKTLRDIDAQYRKRLVSLSYRPCESPLVALEADGVRASGCGLCAPCMAMKLRHQEVSLDQSERLAEGLAHEVLAERSRGRMPDFLRGTHAECPNALAATVRQSTVIVCRCEGGTCARLKQADV